MKKKKKRFTITFNKKEIKYTQGFQSSLGSKKEEI